MARLNPTALGSATRNSSESRIERIARRARELFEARGTGQGIRLDDWMQAEREIDQTASIEEQAWSPPT